VTESIEAKPFCFSAKEGFLDFRLEERIKGFMGFTFASKQCSSWLVDMMEAASQVKDEIAKSYCEGDKVLMVNGGVDKAGRFLEVSIYAEGSRKEVLWLLEGRYGRGW
jgi:membrane carboxypeptidase/penicillin-binding protein PbpC